MQLKDYQQRTLDVLRDYLRTCVEMRDANQAFYATTLKHRGQGVPYREVEGFRGMPYVCIRIPTGGGKTYVACYAVEIAATELVHAEKPIVLWLVPSTPIRNQTVETLRDPDHHNGRALRTAFGAINVLDATQALNLGKAAAETSTTIIVSAIQAFRRETTEDLKVYEDSGQLMDHFAGVTHERAKQLELECYEDGTPKRSLANVLKLRRPIVIMDEAHLARTDLSFETLLRFNPSCILEFTATPSMTKEDPSNVLHSVSVGELHAADMIKMPIRLETRPNWEDLLTDAIGMLNRLQELAEKERLATEEYIRPVMLIQAQPARQGALLTVDKMRDILIENHRIPPERIVRAAYSYNELPDNILKPQCPVRYVITIQELREGWDCPFAYVLCSVAELRSAQAVEQILGRIMRLPKATPKTQPELNNAYAFVASQNFAAAAMRLKEGLVQNGFDAREAEDFVQPLETPSVATLPLFGQEPSAESVASQTKPISVVLPLSVPVLAIRQGDLIERLDEEHFKECDWSLATCDAVLTEEEYSDIRPPGQYGELYVDADKGVQIRFVDNLHDQIFSLIEAEAWTSAELVHWIDQRIYHPDVTQEEAGIFFLQVIRHLTEPRKLSFDLLVRDKYRLREALRKKIDEHRRTAHAAAFRSLCLFDENSSVEVTPEKCFTFDADRYSYSFLYDGDYTFGKHFYPGRVGNLKREGEEVDCAKFIDSLDEVETWIRNIESRPAQSFWLQTSQGKFYPDFVCRLKDGRIFIVEYKGKDRWNDAQEDREIGGLWESRSNRKCIFLMLTERQYDHIRTKIQTTRGA